MSDNEATLSIGAVATDPTGNYVVAGTGEANYNLDAVPGQGVLRSTNGGATFTEVWDGASGNSFGVTKIAFDPRNASNVYVAAYDEGLWRRSPTLDGSATQFDFHKLFAAQFGVPDRTGFALTVKNNATRIYLTDGTANGGGPAGAAAANFWRTDNGDQPAATLLASQAAGSTPPPDTTTYPQAYAGWQNLTAKTTVSPYFATDDFCTGQCWYDEDVYTPAGMPDTVYVIGSNEYGEQPCDTRGVGCGNGRSNGREVLYSTTAGDPDGTANSRTFTDLSYDHTERAATWCAFQPYFDNGCMHAWGGIHPDPDLRGLGRWDDPDEWILRRHPGELRRAAPQRRRAAPDDNGQLPDVQAGALASPDGTHAYQHAAGQHDPVLQRGDRPVQHV